MAILAHQIDANNNFYLAPITFARKKLQFQHEQFEQFEQLHGDSHMSPGRTTRFFMPNMALALVWRSCVAIEKIACCKSSTRGSAWN